MVNPAESASVLVDCGSKWDLKVPPNSRLEVCASEGLGAVSRDLGADGIAEFWDLSFKGFCGFKDVMEGPDFYKVVLLPAWRGRTLKC